MASDLFLLAYPLFLLLGAHNFFLFFKRSEPRGERQRQQKAIHLNLRSLNLTTSYHPELTVQNRYKWGVKQYTHACVNVYAPLSTEVAIMFFPRRIGTEHENRDLRHF